MTLVSCLFIRSCPPNCVEMIFLMCDMCNEFLKSILSTFPYGSILKPPGKCLDDARLCIYGSMKLDFKLQFNFRAWITPRHSLLLVIKVFLIPGNCVHHRHAFRASWRSCGQRLQNSHHEHVRNYLYICRVFLGVQPDLLKTTGGDSWSLRGYPWSEAKFLSVFSEDSLEISQCFLIDCSALDTDKACQPFIFSEAVWQFW